MALKSHWKPVLVLIVVIIVVSSTLALLTRPVETKPVVVGDFSVGPATNSSFNFEVMFNFVNSSSANLISGSVESNASQFSVYVLTIDQFLLWSNLSSNAGAGFISSFPNGSIPVGSIPESMPAATNVAPWSFLYGTTGTGTIHLSGRISPGTQSVVAFLSNSKVASYNPGLAFYHVYLQI